MSPPSFGPPLQPLSTPYTKSPGFPEEPISPRRLTSQAGDLSQGAMKAWGQISQPCHCNSTDVQQDRAPGVFCSWKHMSELSYVPNSSLHFPRKHPCSPGLNSQANLSQGQIRGSQPETQVLCESSSPLNLHQA